MPGHSNKKQTQRTKGNLRPSSSSHAAQLLTMAGGGQSGLLMFGQTPQYVPASSSLDDMDSSLDSDFRMVLRKLTKKDATTKIKGLQEFSDLCKEKHEDCLKAVLPFWPRTYNKIALDVNHRVREAAQHAMSTLALRVRRNIAPYLKSMMGAWLLSQCDTYPTVASAALAAFQDTFPPVKQTEALSFCKENIMEYMTENLVKHIPQSLSDPKTTDPDDMENKYNRILTSSLLAVCKLISSLPTNQIETLKTSLSTLLDDAKFWKHAKSKIGSVKGALYSCLASLCQYLPELSALYMEKMTPLILHNLDEKETGVSQSLWEAVLCLINYVPDCWKCVNVQKAFWPKLKAVLQTGCHGNAVAVSPNLLPLFSEIPADLFPDNNKFYEDFFTTFRTGLAIPSVLKSSSECNALVKAYMECAHYIINNTITMETATHVLLDQVKPVVESSLIEMNSPLCRTCLYGMLSKLLTGLENMPEKETAALTAAQFWNQLKETVEVRLTSSDDTSKKDNFEERLVLLIKSLFYPEFIKQSTVKVKFGDVTDLTKDVSEMKVKKSDKKVELRIEPGKCAKKFLQFVLLIAFEEAHKNFSSAHLRVFAELLELEPSEETVAMVISHCHGEVATETTSHYFVFEICVPWLGKLSRDSLEDINHLIQVVCIFLPVLDGESVRTLLEKLYETCAGTRSESVLLKQLVASSTKQTAVRDWVQGASLGEKLLSRTQAMCQTLCSPTSGQWDSNEGETILEILILVLQTKNDKDEPVIARDYIEIILKTLSGPLSVPKGDSEGAVLFVASAASSFFSLYKECVKSPAAIELMVQLFTVTAGSPINLSENTKSLAMQAWSEGVSQIVCTDGGYLGDGTVLTRLAVAIHEFVAMESLSLSILNQVCDAVGLLLSVLATNLPVDDSAAGSQHNAVFVEYCRMLQVPMAVPVPREVWTYLCIKGDYPGLPIRHTGNTFPTQALFTSLYNCKLLKHLSSTPKTDVMGDSQNEDTWSEDSLTCLLSCIQGAAIVQQFSDLHKSVSSLLDLKEAIDRLQREVKGHVQSLSGTHSDLIVQKAFSRIDLNPEFCLCLRLLFDLLSGDKQCKVDIDLNAVLDRVSVLTEANIYMLSAAITFMTSDDLVTLLEIFVARLLTVSLESVSSLEGGTGLLCVLSQLVKITGKLGIGADVVISSLDQVNAWKEEREDLLLYSCALAEQPAHLILLNVQLSHYLAAIVHTHPDRLTDKHWDFIMCSLVSWISTLEESPGSQLDSSAAQSFLVSVCHLLTVTAHCIRDVVPMATDSFPENLPTEWTEFFSEPIYTAMLPLFVNLCKTKLDSRDTGVVSLLLSSVGEAVSSIPAQYVEEHKLPPLLVAGDLSPLPDSLQTLLNHMCPLLSVNQRTAQVTAYLVLNSIISSLPGYDKEDKSISEGAAASSDQEDDNTRSPPSGIMGIVDECSTVLEMLLCDTSIETNHQIREQDPEYHCTLAYLLSWKLLLTFFKSAPQQLRQEYAAYFLEGGYVHILMYSLFRLLPHNPDSKFQDQPKLLVKGSGQVSEIEQLACEVYKQSLLTMPAMVRNWWKEQDRKTSAYLDSYTTRHVSGHLCKAELQTVQQSDVQLDNMTVKARSSTREVIATYTLEEVSIEMIITLPPNYPLGNIQVISEKRVGVSGPQWEKWLLQLNIFLQHQNGNIMDGLKLWKNNIDKRFEGVDECMICFYVLHGTNFQLPKITCKTCKKKFHSICLYKWFKTSHNCTCPLCRNVF